MSTDASLAATKLRVLVAEHLGAQVDPAPLPGGAGAIVDDTAWVYDADPEGTLGAALLWATHHGAKKLDVIVDLDRRDLVDQATGLRPSPNLWRADGRTIAPIEVAPREPEPEVVDDPVLRELFTSVGLEVIVEHGVVKGEVHGLEVARIAVGPDGPTLRIGVGSFDQEANAVVHQDVPNIDVLTRVVGEVRRHRRPGAPPHPLGRLVRPRWIRSELVREPGRIGLSALDPIPLTRAPRGLNDRQPAAALARAPAELELVLCTVGVDVDLVPLTAELVTHTRPSRVTMVVPERDRHPGLAAASQWLAVESRFVSVEMPWA